MEEATIHVREPVKRDNNNKAPALKELTYAMNTDLFKRFVGSSVIDSID